MGELTELLEIALHDPDEKKREAAGILVVQTLAERGQLNTLAQLSEDSGLTKNTRWAAVSEVLNIFESKGDYHSFAVLAKDELIPDNLREDFRRRIEQAGMKRVEIENEKEHYDCLTFMAGDDELPPSIRELAGMKAVGGYINQKRCGCLIGITENEKLPEKVRKAARNNIESVGMLGLEMLSAIGAADGLIEISMDTKMPIKVREAAGLKAVGICAESGELGLIAEIRKNKRVPTAVRVAAATNMEIAGMKWIEITNDSIRLIVVSQEKTMTDRIRESAGIKGLQIINSPENPWSHNPLPALAKNADLPEIVRETAGMMAVERFIQEELYGRLEKMARDKGFSQAIRDAAGKRLIDICVAKKWGAVLCSLADNESLSESVRKTAKTRMEALGQEFAAGISPGCDVLLSRESVKPPKKGELEKGIDGPSRRKAPVS